MLLAHLFTVSPGSGRIDTSPIGGYRDHMLETERLQLRRFILEDWRDLREYVTLPEVTKYDYEYPSSDEELRDVVEYFADHAGYWAVCLKATGKLIGHVVCTQKEPEALRTWSLGYIFNPAFYGQGYATEACRRVAAYVFEDLGAHRIEAGCDPRNAPSWRLLERLGMRREAHRLKAMFLRTTPDGEPVWVDSYEYAVLEEEWGGSPAVQSAR
jgi:[ribosomal protein S5]-alanine N-acetyltransferase